MVLRLRWLIARGTNPNKVPTETTSSFVLLGRGILWQLMYSPLSFLPSPTVITWEPALSPFPKVPFFRKNPHGTKVIRSRIKSFLTTPSLWQRPNLGPLQWIWRVVHQIVLLILHNPSSFLHPSNVALHPNLP